MVIQHKFILFYNLLLNEFGNFRAVGGSNEKPTSITFLIYNRVFSLYRFTSNILRSRSNKGRNFDSLDQPETLLAFHTFLEEGAKAYVKKAKDDTKNWLISYAKASFLILLMTLGTFLSISIPLPRNRSSTLTMMTEFRFLQTTAAEVRSMTSFRYLPTTTTEVRSLIQVDSSNISFPRQWYQR